MSFIFKSLLTPTGKTNLRGCMPALLIFVFFVCLNSSFAQLPLSTGAPYVGQKAPAFALPDQNGKLVSLADLLKPMPGGKKTAGVALIFYRGYW
jgi:hypothetical protein